MKNQKIIYRSIVILFLAVLTACGPEPVTEASKPVAGLRYGLIEAAEKGWVEYEAAGNGNSSGVAMTLAVKNISGSPLEIEIEPGTVFGSLNSGVQSMVAGGYIWIDNNDTQNGNFYEPVFSLNLPTSVTTLVHLDVFCLDFELNNPSANDGFAIQATLAERPAKIIQQGYANDNNISVIQSAIWMDQGVSPEEIAEKFPATNEDLEEAWKLLLQSVGS